MVQGTAGATGVHNNLLNKGVFAGGITNSGSISGFPTAGVNVVSVSSFSGNIVNANGGLISAGPVTGVPGQGIAVANVLTFAGNISNAGTILTGGVGIVVAGVSDVAPVSFLGAISNSGTISGGVETGIAVAGLATLSSGISNSGLISALRDIRVTAGETPFGAEVAASTFSGGITNTGVLTAFSVGVAVTDVTSFQGNISNQATIVGAVAAVTTSLALAGSNISGSLVNSAALTLASSVVAIA